MKKQIIYTKAELQDKIVAYTEELESVDDYPGEELETTERIQELTDLIMSLEAQIMNREYIL